MNLNKHDVERIVETMLNSLTIEVVDGNFTDPNSRTVLLKYNGNEIGRASFDVVQKSEYEG